MKYILYLLVFLLPCFAFGQSSDALLEKAQGDAAAGELSQANLTLDQLIRKYPNRLYDMASAYLLKSKTLLKLGQYQEALKANARSLELQEQLASDELALNYLQEARIIAATGDWTKSIQLLRKAESFPFESGQLFAEIYVEMAEALLALEHYDQAASFAEQAIEIISIEGSADNDIRFRAYQQALKANLAQQKMEEAGLTFLQIVEEAGTTAKFYPLVLQLFPEKEPAATAREALTLLRPSLDANEREAAETLLEVASQLESPATASIKNILVDEAIMALLLPTGSGAPADDRESQIVIDELLLAQALADKAATSGSLEVATSAISLFEKHVRLHPDESAHLLNNKNWKRIYSVAIQQAVDASNPTLALTFAAQAKSVFQHLLIMAALWHEGQIPPALSPDLEQMRMWERQFQQKPQNKRYQDLYLKAVERFESTASELAGPQIHNFWPSFSIDIAKARQEIEAEEATIVYHIDPPFATAFVLRTDQLEVVSLNWNDLPNIAVLLQSTLPGSYQQQAQQWYAQVFESIRPQLNGIKHLHIIPDPMLDGLPFEALVKPGKPGADSFKDLSYLVEDYQISYGYELESLLKKGATNPGRPIGFAGLAPQLSDAFLPESIQLYFDTTLGLFPALHALAPEGRQLRPFAQQASVGAISRHFERKGQLHKIYSASDANEGQWRIAASVHRYVHLAVPAFLTDNHPPYGGLLLAGKTDMADNLSIANLLETKIFAELVSISTLFSSEKTPYAQAVGDALLLGGTQNLVLPVHSQFSEGFFDHFYRQIADGKKPATAIQQAKLKMIKDEKTAAPANWATYLLFN